MFQVVKEIQGNLGSEKMMPVKPKRGFKKSILVLTLILLGFATTMAQEPLILGIHPYLSREEIIKKFSPLRVYLYNKLKKEVIIKIGNTYEDHIKSIGLNKVDIAFVGPSEYVFLVNEFGYQKVICTLDVNGKPFFRGKIITSKDAPIFSLKDLIGKSFAFVQKESTMGFIIPEIMMRKVGVKLSSLKYYNFVGTHENVVYGILAGDYDAGAVKEEVYKRFKHTPIKIIATTPPIPEHLFLVRRTMPDKLFRKIKQAFFELNKTKEGLNILKSINSAATGIEPVNDKDYDVLREYMK